MHCRLRRITKDPMSLMPFCHVSDELSDGR